MSKHGASRPGAPGTHRAFDGAPAETGCGRIRRIMQRNVPNQAAAWTALLLGAAISAMAQGTIPDAPQVTEINPPSAARGSTVDVSLGGQKLTGTRGLSCRFSAYPDLIPVAPRGLTADVLSAAEGQVKARIAIAPDA